MYTRNKGPDLTAGSVEVLGQDVCNSTWTTEGNVKGIWAGH